MDGRINQTYHYCYYYNYATATTTITTYNCSNCTRFSRYKVDPIFLSFCVLARARARIYSWHPGAIARTAYFDLDKSEEPLVGNTSTYDCADSRYVV